MSETDPPQATAFDAPAGLTMTVAEYCRLAGVGECAVRQDIAANRIPHRKFGKRGLIRILRGPALAQLSESQ